MMMMMVFLAQVQWVRACACCGAEKRGRRESREGQTEKKEKETEKKKKKKKDENK